MHKDDDIDLQEIGCSDELISHLHHCHDKQKILLLRKHRCDLLEKMHKIQKQIDDCDDILYRLKKEGVGNEKNRKSKI